MVMNFVVRDNAYCITDNTAQSIAKVQHDVGGGLVFRDELVGAVHRKNAKNIRPVFHFFVFAKTTVSVSFFFFFPFRTRPRTTCFPR